MRSTGNRSKYQPTRNDYHISKKYQIRQKREHGLWTYPESNPPQLPELSHCRVLPHWAYLITERIEVENSLCETVAYLAWPEWAVHLWRQTTDLQLLVEQEEECDRDSLEAEVMADVDRGLQVLFEGARAVPRR